MKKNILVIVAHPDDEILGCGATLAKLARNNHKVHCLITAEGITSRNDSNRKKHLNDLQKATLASSKIIKFSSVQSLKLPDNRLYSVDFLKIAKTYEKIINILKPRIIFTHHPGDLNLDHEIVNRAVLTATRPIAKTYIKKILTFETPSSTEWNFDTAKSFIPNYFENVEKFMKYKLKALKAYKSEMRPFPHPRSVENIKALAKFRGSTVGYKYAEAFRLVREIKD
jgi:LmbE family N-acetylglucosaminyl deacetylase|tara:strand:+ start:826 stop:1503 length:678 start_codon:yes stop_codon:yes gene_type:complete